MIGVIFLAAGNGNRFGRSALPKQFSRIMGEPLFTHAVRPYLAIDTVSRLVLVARPDLLEETRAALAGGDLFDRIALVPGGQTRRDSVRNGISELRPEAGFNDGDIVVLHNAASPNTPVELIERCLEAMGEADAVQAYVPELRTLFEMEAGDIKAVLDRPSLACSCDPTMYRARVLERALERQRALGLEGDTTCDLVRALGVSMRLVESSYDNIKVTTRWDLDAVSAAMAARFP